MRRFILCIVHVEPHTAGNFASEIFIRKPIIFFSATALNTTSLQNAVYATLSAKMWSNAKSLLYTPATFIEICIIANEVKQYLGRTA